jgi:PAS domain S-box-containing protein
MFEDLAPSLRQFTSSQSFLALMESVAGMGFWLYSPEDECVYLSSKLAKILATEERRLSSKKFFSFFTEAFHESLTKEFRRGPEKNTVWTEVVFLKIHSQETVPCRIWVKSCKEGEVRCLLGGLKDIKKEKEQGDYRKVLSQVVEHTSEGIIITDSQGRTVYVNHGFEVLSGYTMDEMLGIKPGKKLQGPETSLDTIEFISHRLMEKKSFSCEILNYHKDGHSYWIRLAVHPRFDKHGKLTHYMAIETDISGERMVQEALKVQQDNLQQEIENRLRLEKELRHLAQNDPLTGIANDGFFYRNFIKKSKGPIATLGLCPW